MKEQKPDKPTTPVSRPSPIQKEGYQPTTGPANPKPPQGGSGTEPPASKPTSK